MAKDMYHAFIDWGKKNFENISLQDMCEDCKKVYLTTLQNKIDITTNTNSADRVAKIDKYRKKFNEVLSMPAVDFVKKYGVNNEQQQMEQDIKTIDKQLESHEGPVVMNKNVDFHMKKYDEWSEQKQAAEQAISAWQKMSDEEKLYTAACKMQYQTKKETKRNYGETIHAETEFLMQNFGHDFNAIKDFLKGLPERIELPKEHVLERED